MSWKRGSGPLQLVVVVGRRIRLFLLHPPPPPPLSLTFLTIMTITSCFIRMAGNWDTWISGLRLLLMHNTDNGGDRGGRGGGGGMVVETNDLFHLPARPLHHIPPRLLLLFRAPYVLLLGMVVVAVVMMMVMHHKEDVGDNQSLAHVLDQLPLRLLLNSAMCLLLHRVVVVVTDEGCVVVYPLPTIVAASAEAGAVDDIAVKAITVDGGLDLDPSLVAVEIERRSGVMMMRMMVVDRGNIDIMHLRVLDLDLGTVM